MFKNVIVRRPSRSMVNGITGNANYGIPDYEKAVKQHNQYIDALKKCGVEVTVLEADERYPDSCFVEDVAVVTEKCAVITKPGAESRQGEEKEIIEVLKRFHDNIEYIEAPATLEGGDIMMVGNHFYIGLSKRTNKKGANQLIKILEKYGYTASTVPVKTILHFKTGMTYIENNNMLITSEFTDNDEFAKFNQIVISDEDAYSSNCIWMNDTVLVPAGYETAKKIEELGYKVIEVPMTEFQKLDGGLTCLSLRF